jgi:hypothetical protein
MNKDTEILNADLSVVGIALALLFVAYYYTVAMITQNKLSNDLFEAKKLTVYYYDRSDSMENSVISLNEHIDYLEGIISQKDALDDETAKLKRIVLELRLDTQKKKKLKD